MSSQPNVWRKGSAAIATVAALAASSTGVEAGGFAVREQSAVFQGSSFAGNAAGGALSSMFWNPAAVGQFDGINTESAYSLIIPQTEVTALPGSTLLFGGAPADGGNIAKDAVVPSSYVSYQLSRDLVFGLSINAPFGLATEPENRFWAGQTQARTSKIETYNFQPVLAYRIAPSLIVAAGLQIERFEATLKNATGGSPLSPNAVASAEDTGLGFTAGVLWQPTLATSVGLGFRSSIDHNLDGTLKVVGTPLGASVEADIQTPETVTLSLRQALTPQLTGLASVEWSNWSRLKSLDIVCTSAQPALGCTAPGATARSLALGWHDGWFVSAGLEYAMNPALTLRTGVAWEQSPIQDPDERTLRLPDADRIWASIGASYRWSRNITLDVAYSHIFVDDATIDRTESGVRLVADVDSQVDILSVGLRIKLGDEPAPLK
jgi:long-chain fatty acid transport protein